MAVRPALDCKSVNAVWSCSNGSPPKVHGPLLSVAVLDLAASLVGSCSLRRKQKGLLS